MKLFVAIYDDCCLLPHFIKHYLKLGVQTFYIAASPRVVPTVVQETMGLDVVVRSDVDERDSLEGGPSALMGMRVAYSGNDEWVLIVDLDEFLETETPIAAVLAHADSEGANVVRARMVDRVSADGSMAAINPETDLWSTFPRQCSLTSLLQGSVDYKGLFVRGHLRPAMAHHQFQDERIASEWLRLHHFKWNSNAEQRLRLARDWVKAAGITWWTEYDTVLKHLEAHGRLRWEDFPPPA